MTGSWTRGQWALRAVAASGPVLAVASTALAGRPAPVWLLLVTALFSLVHARWPGSVAGLTASALAVLWWLAVAGAGVPPAVLLAAAALLASHVAGLVADLGPDRLGVDPATLRRWVLRGTAALAAAPLTWAGVRLLGDHDGSPTLWTVGLLVALVGTVAATAALSAVAAVGSAAGGRR